ncbi:MAG: RimK family alpha-L-glutamate ligase [Acidimicrobiia bacterium]|nr:RimK family alpha-L-glutamate ligase [Acidimicrobiia bacterium]
MRLAILSREPRSYSTQRLKEAAIDAGHQVRILDTLRFAIDLSGGEPDLHYSGRQLSDYDAVLPRVGSSITYFGTAVVRQFEQMDVYTPNTSAGIRNSRDKLAAHQILARHDIGMPATTFVRDRADVGPAIERVGGAPVIVKLHEGTQGVGVILAPDDVVATAMIETLLATRQNVLVQEFIEESRGRDIRALVVGDRVIGAMRRSSRSGDFRSNLHRGGRSEVIELPPEFEAAALRSAQIMGLRVAGVDMLESERGPLVLEINSSPGLQGIEGATGKNIARAIVDFVSRQVAFPELDVRQRLSISIEYGVAELLVREDGSFVGRTIADSGLDELDITVLTVQRGTSVIPNPRRPFVLEANDRLLCFGKLEEMRSMVPRRRPRRVQPIRSDESTED